MRAVAFLLAIAGVSVIGFGIFMFAALSSLSGLSPSGTGPGGVIIPLFVAAIGVLMLFGARAMLRSNRRPGE
jgi:hypothetical protein